MIRLENVSYAYPQGFGGDGGALYDINLTVEDGTVTALVGHTGSGKSTLIQTMNLLLRPTSGRIFIDGEEITAKKINLREVRRKVGIVFQYPENQLFEETVYKDIAFAPKNMGISGKELDEAVHTAARAAGLDEKLLNRSPFELSGGQKRRAAIAGVLAMKPKILILDEPTAGLDPQGRADISDMILALREKNADMSIIFISHFMDSVVKTADNVMVMAHGRLIAHDGVKEIFSNEALLKEAGLDVPRITKIAALLKDRGLDLGEGIFTLEEAADRIEKICKGEK